MKNILQLLCISLVVGTVMAGTEIYNPVFYGPVAIGQWSAVSNFAGVAATNGAYTNSVTYQYRLTATNSLGRLPYTVTNSVVIDGATNNSAHLTWTYTPRVSCYVLERGTTGTWDQFVRIGASLTNAWDDGSSLVWMNGNYAATNECALSDFPTVGVTAGTFYDGAQGDAVSNAVSGLTNDVAVLQTNTATKAQGALADTALQVEADTNALFQLNAHATNAANPHGVTAAQIGAATGSPLYAFTEVDPAYATGGVQRIDTNGWVVSPHEAWLTTEVDPAYATGGVQRVDTNGWEVGSHAAFLTAEVDPAYATGAVQLAGSTMTGPLTNEYGFYGNGAGLTNLASDPSGWSGYAATQQVVWYEYEIVDDTNYVVITGDTQPATAGIYYWTERSPATGYYNNDDYLWHESSTWTIVLPSYELITEWTGGVGEDPRGEYSPHANSTGTATVVYGTQTNLVTWRAGYDTTIGAWAVSRNGTNVQAWYPGSIVLTGPVVIGGVSRESWPSEYDDSELSNAIWGMGVVVSNLQGANLSELSNNVFSVATELTNAATAATNYTDSLGLIVTNLATEITNAATAASNYADSVCSAAGLVASNALSMDGGGTVTGDVAVTGGVTAGTLALTNGPVAGSVWVCTNSNGSGELRVLAKCQIFPRGSIPVNQLYTNAVWTTSGMFNIGDMTASERGIMVNRAGTYMASYVYNIEGITSTATRVRGRIVIDGAGINYGPLVLSAGAYASISETAIASCASGSVISVMYYLYSSDEGLTNRATQGGHLSVIELP